MSLAILSSAENAHLLTNYLLCDLLSSQVCCGVGELWNIPICQPTGRQYLRQLLYHGGCRSSQASSNLVSVLKVRNEFTLAFFIFIVVNFDILGIVWDSTFCTWFIDCL